MNEKLTIEEQIEQYDMLCRQLIMYIIWNTENKEVIRKATNERERIMNRERETNGSD